MMRVVNVKAWILELTLLLALSTVLFAIAISLLDSDMLLPRLLLCVCLLCLDYLFLLLLTVPPSLRIALARARRFPPSLFSSLLSSLLSSFCLLFSGRCSFLFFN